jgi:hypothetical protein
MGELLWGFPIGKLHLHLHTPRLYFDATAAAFAVHISV